MKKTEGIVLLIAGAIVAIVFGLIGGLMLHFNNKFIENSVEVTATIQNIRVSGSGDDKTHDVYVGYTFNGIEYNNVRISEYSSSMYEGKVITLRCNPDEPGKVKDTTVIKVIGIVFTAVGVVFLVICTIASIACFKYKPKNDSQGRGTGVNSTINNNVNDPNASPYGDERFDYWNSNEKYPDISSSNPYASTENKDKY